MADRLLFSKTGRAKYISHLDLMRTFQRAFTRAGIEIKHTQGFHKHPFVSIALPLSVGYSSQCEILEFGLVGGATAEEVPARLTAAMPEGIIIHQCYPAERKLKELAYVNYIINFEYSEGRPQASEPAMRELLSREGDTLYTTFEVYAGPMAKLTPAELWAGRQTRGEGSPLRLAYLDRLLRQTERAIAGLKRSKRPEDASRLAELEQVHQGLLDMKEEWLSWQR